MTDLFPSLSISRLIAPTCLLLCACVADASAASRVLQPVVNVTGGSIQGYVLPDSHGSAFRGIPFAQPPIGHLRWREPVPVANWKGVRDATKPASPCAQNADGSSGEKAVIGKEDCLYLDVWTPAGATQARKPVMVWIHGGSNIGGRGGSDSLSEGNVLIQHGVVLVVIQYRLDIFGFLAHPELTRESPHHASGNYGILDQVAALRWVHDNIAAFGGDPGNVTIFGQSAGSVDVVALMASPLSRGLFHRAIAESGGIGIGFSRPLKEAEEIGVRETASLNAQGGASLSQLRVLPPEALLKVKHPFNSFTTDGRVFPDSILDVWRTRREHPVPLIIGNTAVEFRTASSLDEMKGTIQSLFGDLAPRALALYGLDGKAQPASDPLYGDALDQWGADVFRCFEIIEGGSHSSAGNSVWQYQFDRAIPPRPRVEHSSEVPYVFGNLRATGNGAGDFQDADRRLSAIVRGYWTNFAKTGNPNGPGLPPWQGYDLKDKKYLEFTTSADVVLKANQRGPFVELFREMLERLPSTH